MTKRRSSSVPPWVLLRPDGELVRKEEGVDQLPTRLLEDGPPGTILAFPAGGTFVVLAPSSSSRVEWLSAVDKFADGRSVRRVGPAIIPGGNEPVRLWVGPDGRLVGLADGPIEQVLSAIKRIRDAGCD